MADTKYTYAISTDFPNGIVDVGRLDAEIRSSNIKTAIRTISTTGDTCDIWFKDALVAEDKTLLDNDASPPTAGSIVGDHSGAVLIVPSAVSLSHKTTTDDRIRVAMEKSDASSLDFYTHNWCDKTTWYEGAVRIVDEVAADMGAQTTYNVLQTNLIDTYHGKITGEDSLLDSGSNSYRVVVKVNDVEKAEQDPHTGSGGDYTVNYDAGTVTFLSALQPADEVKVTYHYAQNSLITLIPDAGKKLIVEVAEVQFSSDVIINDTVVFETYGLVDVFAPQLVDNPYPSGTKIPIKTFKYKTIRDYQNAAFKSYPTYPALGGSSWRGLTQPVVVLDWDYQRGLALHSTYGMEVRLSLEHDAAFGGTYATATLYCGEENETA